MTTNHLREAAAILAGWPETVARLREAHVARPDGRCRGCVSQVHPAPMWPCSLALIATWATTPQP